MFDIRAGLYLKGGREIHWGGMGGTGKTWLRWGWMFGIMIGEGYLVAGMVGYGE